MRLPITLRASTFVLGTLALAACGDNGMPVAPDAGDALLARNTAPGVHRQYGPPIRLGDGRVRTYVVVDQRSGEPLELGVAIDARTLEGELPADAMNFVMTLPQLAPEPYEFMLFDWNPAGHEPPGVYTLPHFDFHFYMTPWSEVEAIDPTNPDYVAMANAVPTGDFVPPFYFVPAPPGSYHLAAVPRMGVHWLDVRAPELQNLLGNPAGYQEFTKTLIYGTWGGRITFIEPMITRAYLLGRPDVTTSFPTPARYPESGWYPDAYRIRYDAQAREYLVSLVGFTEH